MPAAEAWMKTKLPPHGKDHRTGGGARKQREVIFPMLATDTAEDLRGQGAKKLEVHGQRNVQPKGRREGMMYLKG